MKKYILPILAALLLCGAKTSAQTDSRNRTVETIVVDGLAQLPTKSSAAFAAVIGELASTGDKGIIQIASRLVPPANGKNAVFEYAIGGITDYVTTADGEKYRASVRKGLAEAIEKSGDVDNKAFLIQQLAKCATKDDMAVFSKYLQDEKLSKYAFAAITSIAGNDTELIYLVKNANLPHIELAKIVTMRKLQGLEEVLLSWTNTNDVNTLNEVYNALATVGTWNSVKTLAAAAKKVNYLPDPTGATNSYAKLLGSLERDNKNIQKYAKPLMSSANPAVRCAGLGLWLKAAGSDGTKDVISALKDKDIQYRNTALALAPEYCGEGIFASVVAGFGKLSAPAKIDVIRWIGNNHAKAGENIVAESFASGDTTLAREAIAAASKIGGEKMLAALVKEISGANANEAKAALLSFNGNINGEIIKTLNTATDAKTIVPALEIAGTRHIHDAYQKVASLTQSADAVVSNAAFSALGGVASPAVYNDVCLMLDKSQGESTAKLQKAAAAAIAAQSGDKQFELVSASMKKSSHPEYYYPLLAQAATDGAIAEIEKGMAQGNTSKAASDAMLKVNNPAVLPILIKMARKAQGDEKDNILGRYLTLTEKNNVNAVRKYQLLRDALDLKPSDKLTNRILSDLGNTRTVQALTVVPNYLDVPACARAAAEAVRAIISQNGALNGGKDVRAALQKAKDVFAKDKANGDADAGYAMDDVNGMLAKTAENGPSLSSKVATGADAEVKGDKQYENFSMTFDWKTDDAASLVLRGTPMFALYKKGVCAVGSKEEKACNAEGEWNTLEVKVVDDRIFAVLNGENIAVNALLPEVSGAQSVPATGKIQLLSKDGNLSVRDFNITELPSTPVYELSDEEKKAGFEVLFDGRSLEKWQGNTSNYVPQEGNIFVSANYGGSGNLYTKKKYSDFVYRFEFCFVQPGVNNGIGIRTNIGSDAAYDGMEIQVLDHDDPIYEGLHEYQQHGAVYGIIVPKHVTFGKPGTWNVEEIRAVGDRITVTVNGEVILDGNIREACQGHNVAPDGSGNNPYTVDHKNHPGLFNKEGYISFCGHGPGIKFRNVRILDLSKNNKKRR